MAAIAIPIPPLMSVGESPSAKFVAEQYRNGRRSLEETFTFGDSLKALAELDDVCQTCSTPNWDGYNASPVSLATCSSAFEFLCALPLGTPSPTVSAEPDGDITLEWYQSPVRILSVSVSADAKLHHALLFGASKLYGSEPFYGSVPQPILESIYRVMAA